MHSQESTLEKTMPPAAPPRQEDGPPCLIVAANVAKRFGGLTVLEDISMSIPEKSIVGLIGPNGAGKSTFFNILTGFLRPNEGSIGFQGADITSAPPETRSRMGLARTFQIVRPFRHLTAAENAMVGCLKSARSTKDARATALAALRSVGLETRADAPAHSLTLSDLKRLELARCLATSPKVLLLDEVMGGLNPTEMQDMIELIGNLRQQGMTIVLVEHIMDAIISLADELHVLTSGRLIASGEPQTVLSQSKVVEAYLGGDL